MRGTEKAEIKVVSSNKAPVNPPKTPKSPAKKQPDILGEVRAMGKALTSLTDTVAKMKLPVSEGKGNSQGQNFKSNYGGGYSNKDYSAPKLCIVCGDLHWVRDCPTIVIARKSLSSKKGKSPDRTRHKGKGRGRDRESDREQSTSKSADNQERKDKSNSSSLN